MNGQNIILTASVKPEQQTILKIGYSGSVETLRTKNKLNLQS